MVRTGHCARPGCGEPATALLTYDYGERVAWLDRLVDVLVGLFAQAVAGSVVYAISGNQLTLAAVAAGLFGLWAGLAGTAYYATRTKGSGSLVRDFGLRIAGAKDVAGGFAIGVACQ